MQNLNSFLGHSCWSQNKQSLEFQGRKTMIQIPATLLVTRTTVQSTRVLEWNVHAAKQMLTSLPGYLRHLISSPSMSSLIIKLYANTPNTASPTPEGSTFPVPMAREHAQGSSISACPLTHGSRWKRSISVLELMESLVRLPWFANLPRRTNTSRTRSVSFDCSRYQTQGRRQ